MTWEGLCDECGSRNVVYQSPMYDLCAHCAGDICNIEDDLEDKALGDNG